MHKWSLLAGLVLVGLGVIVWASIPKESESEGALLQSEFDFFSEKFNKNYASLAEKSFRFGIFCDNYRFIQAHNKKGLSYSMGVNEFADLTFEEFSARFLRPLGPAAPTLSSLGSSPVREADTHVDWRDQGVVKGVTDQRYLYSSSLAVASAIATNHMILHKKDIPDLAAQELNDCAPIDPFSNHILQSHLYAVSKGINTAEKYPTQEKPAACRTDLSGRGDYKVFRIDTIDDGPRHLLSNALTRTAVTAMIVTREFQFYRGGIFKHDWCFGPLNLAVHVIGAHMSPNTFDSWYIAKNSWGTSWGEQGFFRMAAVETSSGVCGFTTKGYMMVPVFIYD